MSGGVVDSATARDALNVSFIDYSPSRRCFVHCVSKPCPMSHNFPSKLFVLSPQRSPFIMERVGWLSLGRGVVHHLKLTPEQQLLEDASPS